MGEHGSPVSASICSIYDTAAQIAAGRRSRTMAAWGSGDLGRTAGGEE
jgi:hypothetical protein